MPAELESTFRQEGIESLAIEYGKGFGHYYRELGKVVRNHSVTTVHICYFDYFSAMAWLARLLDVKSIVYEAVNSGEFRARSWKKHLLRLRTRVATEPISRVIAISQFVRRQVEEGGLLVEKVWVRYLGIDDRRFAPNPEAWQMLVNEFRLRPEECALDDGFVSESV